MTREEALEEIKNEKEYKKLLKELEEDINRYTILVEYAQDDMDEDFFKEDLKRTEKKVKQVQEKLAKIAEYKKEFNV